MDRHKQVIVVNEGLLMPRGKLAAQVAHASVAALFIADPDVVEQWLEDGMAKIVLQVPTEAALLDLYQRAKTANLPVQTIRDVGRTVLPQGTLTCIGIGPAAISEIDLLTSQLKLLR